MTGVETRELHVHYPGNELAKRLQAKGAELGKSHGARYWKGFRIAVQKEHPGGGGDGGAEAYPKTPHEQVQEGFRVNDGPGDPAAPREPSDDILDETEYEAEFGWRNRQ